MKPKHHRHAIAYAQELKLDAQRKLGEILRETPKAKGTAGAARGRDVSGNTVLVSPENEAPTLAELGISLKESAEAQFLATLPDEVTVILFSSTALITSGAPLSTTTFASLYF